MGDEYGDGLGALLKLSHLLLCKAGSAQHKGFSVLYTSPCHFHGALSGGKINYAVAHGNYLFHVVIGVCAYEVCLCGNAHVTAYVVPALGAYAAHNLKIAGPLQRFSSHKLAHFSPRRTYRQLHKLIPSVFIFYTTSIACSPLAFMQPIMAASGV